MKKKLKSIWKILLVCVFILIFLITLIFLVHRMKLHKEYQYLSDNGYIHLVNVGDYNLNIYQYGNESSTHKIIGMSGRGVNNYGIEMKYALEGLDDDNFIVFVDRAGYGYSDDTRIKQTVEQVVEDYRNALKNSGIEPPYILMPHSLGGVYATYWVSVYPEEIECVIFIDTTEIGCDVWEKEDYSVSTYDRISVFACGVGLQRVALHKFFIHCLQLIRKKTRK